MDLPVLILVLAVILIYMTKFIFEIVRLREYFLKIMADNDKISDRIL